MKNMDINSVIAVIFILIGLYFAFTEPIQPVKKEPWKEDKSSPAFDEHPEGKPIWYDGKFYSVDEAVGEGIVTEEHLRNTNGSGTMYILKIKKPRKI